MAKSPIDKKRDEVLKRVLQTPHKPHVPVKKATQKPKVDKSVAKRKKGDGSTPRKSRRP